MPLVLAGLALAFLVMLLFGGTELDRGLLILLHARERPELTAAAEGIRLATGAIPLMVATGFAAGWLALRVSSRKALLLLATILGGRLLAALLAAWTLPLRPEAPERILPTQMPVFPDPNAANAAITLLVLAFLVTRQVPARALALLFAFMASIAAGTAQVALGIAWPTDVIGAWAFALCWTLLLLWLAGEDLGDGTARQVHPAVSPSGTPMSDCSPAFPPPAPASARGVPPPPPHPPAP